MKFEKNVKLSSNFRKCKFKEIKNLSSYITTCVQKKYPQGDKTPFCLLENQNLNLFWKINNMNLTVIFASTWMLSYNNWKWLLSNFRKCKFKEIKNLSSYITTCVQKKYPQGDKTPFCLLENQNLNLFWKINNMNLTVIFASTWMLSYNNWKWFGILQLMKRYWL